MHRTRLTALFCIVSLCITVLAAYPAAPLGASVGPVPSRPPVLNARSAILIEALTGAVLYESHADDRIPPASLTKLMTLHLALREVEEGRLNPSEVLVPGPDAWARNMPPRSSVMFLGPNQKLTVSQLLTGLVVDSGNDAAVEVAERVAGSVPAFVDMMNREAARLGYPDMHFEDPAGINASNTITARDYADFSRKFLFAHPDALKELFSVREFTYPLPGNLTGGNREKPVTQSNRNVLLGKYAGADGLKTGYIDESGYNLAATAERAGMRLISVILGVPDTAATSGSVLRAVESAALLDYGFSTFMTVRAAFEEPVPAHVWKGRERTVVLSASPRPIVAVRKDQTASVRAEVLQTFDVEAPVRAGQVLGAIVVTLGGTELARFPLRAGADVDRGGLVRRIVDSIVIFFRGIHPARLPA